VHSLRGSTKKPHRSGAFRVNPAGEAKYHLQPVGELRSFVTARFKTWKKYTESYKSIQDVTTSLFCYLAAAFKAVRLSARKLFDVVKQGLASNLGLLGKWKPTLLRSSDQAVGKIMQVRFLPVTTSNSFLKNKRIPIHVSTTRDCRPAFEGGYKQGLRVTQIGRGIGSPGMDAELFPDIGRHVKQFDLAGLPNSPLMWSIV